VHSANKTDRDKVEKGEEGRNSETKRKERDGLSVLKSIFIQKSIFNNG